MPASASELDRGFVSKPDPDHPGWYTWNLRDPTRFNGQILGPMRVRRDADEPGGGAGKVRVRMDPERRHTNLADNLHGGIVLSLIDVSLFGASRMYGLIDAGTAVTLDLSVQFIGAGKSGQPLDSVVELLRETRRLLFLRGIVEQGDHMVAAFSGTIRKPAAK